MMIVCLFSVENRYDQPPNNLVAWWAERPDLTTLARAMGLKFPCERDEDTLAVVRVWSLEQSARVGEADWRLEWIGEGQLR